jgi:hypothetical protein
MKSLRIVVLLLCASLLPTVLAAQADAVTTYQSFNPQTGQNNLTQHIFYRFPDPVRFGNGPFPLAMWIPGTIALYQDAFAQIFVRQMAARGFVAASVEYSNTNPVQFCSDYTNRAQGVFEASRSTSAVGVMCSFSRVNCGKGIVVSGISQGGAMSVLAKNYAPQVQAVYALSIGTFNSVGFINLSSCLADAVTAITPDRLTVINGASDPAFVGQDPIMNLSGVTCAPGTFQCWSPTGSGGGWYIVKDSQVQDRSADHCYPLVGNCTSPFDFDHGWFYEAANNWSLKPNLDWLATLGTQRVFSSNGQ